MVVHFERMRKLRHGCAGHAVLTFGLMLVPMISGAGLLRDLQAAGNVRQSLQMEADAAALAVARAAVQIQTSPANASKSQAERNALIEQRAAAILSARQAVAQSRSADGAAAVILFGRWEEPLKTEYAVTASSSVKRSLTLAVMGGGEQAAPIRISATAKVDVTTSASATALRLSNTDSKAGEQR